MKKLIMLIMVLGIGLFMSVPAQAGFNQIGNPGFEDDEIGVANRPDLWFHFGGGTQVYHEDEVGNANTGNDCMEIGSTEAMFVVLYPITPGGGGLDKAYIPVTAGVDYTFAAYIRDALPGGSPSTMPPYLKFEWYTAPGGSVITEAVAITEFVSDGNYKQYIRIRKAPSGYPYFLPVLVSEWGIEGAINLYFFDDAYFGEGPPPPLPYPREPNPCYGCSVSPNTDELSWTNPEGRQGDAVTVDVLFDEGSFDPGTANKIVDGREVNSVTLSDPPDGTPVTLQPEEYYFWRVDVNDPNGTSPVFTQGAVWTFNTVNALPTVDAGKKQAAWLTSPVTVQLDATVTDDGAPDPPGVVSLKWDTLSGPDTPLFDDDTAEDPNVTFDTVGEYTLRLTATDANRAPVPGSADPDDTVVVNVYDASYTGLVAHWSFENNLVDSVGGHNGTISGSATYVPGGQVGKAIDLAGGDYVYIGDSGGGDKWCDPNQGIIDEEITLSAWVRHTGADGDDDEKENQAIVSKGESQWQMSRAGWDGNNHFEVEGLSPISDAQGTNDIYDNKWHHLVASYNGEEIALYFDGRLDIPEPLQTSGNINAISYQYQIWIGANSEAVDREWGGLIDEVRIYEIGLPHDKVLELFRAEGGANSCDEPPEYDANGDCYVDLVDLALAANDFMECNDVGGTCQDDPENENY